MKILSKICVICIILLHTASFAQSTKINSDWLFKLKDEAAAQNANYNDSRWEKVNVPHDWAFELGYSETGAQGDKGGYASGGIGWYRKYVNINSKDLNGAYYFLDFDAIYMNSEVWINGNYLGKRPYGYISFSYDITKYVTAGENVISVRVDNSLEPSARWYHGCGIYGDVTLRRKAGAYVEKDITFVKTPGKIKPDGSLDVSTEIVLRDKAGKYSVICDVVNSKGSVVGSLDSYTANMNKGVNNVNIKGKVRKPILWSPETPKVYTLKMTLKDINGTTIDTQDVKFGFRTITWKAKTGIYLNGENVKLKGMCEHLEGGPTGAILPEKLIRWRLQLLQDMGCNAVRVAHNPQLPLFYDICDEMGIFVMDEIFDGWNKKAEFDYGMQAFDEWWERDLRSWIRRDRNHPSIFMYSIGNETHGEIGSELLKACHEEDNTRLVTSGDCEADLMDVIGKNGNSEKVTFLKEFETTDRAFIGTENPHTWLVRGFYRTLTWYRNGKNNPKFDSFDIPDLTEKEIFCYDWTAPENKTSAKQVFNSSYDNATVRITARHHIEQFRDKNWFSGSFRWTGFDYVGEAGYVHGGWPFRAFMGGAMDLAGFRKDLFYLYQSEWHENIDMVHILPHWTHPKMAKGEKIPVWVYTSGDEVELFLNGESLGKQKKGLKWNEMQCEWLTPWSEGTLEAVAYRKGKEIARTTMSTSGAPTNLEVVTDNSNLAPCMSDVAIVTIREKDDKGTTYPYGENRVYVYLKGEARVLAFESGNPVDTETTFDANSKCCFFGLNRVFVQPDKYGSKGVVNMYVGSICGDKKLWLSDKVAIDVQNIALRGNAKKENIKVYYTTDGSKPTKSSKVYSAPFKIAEGTTVKAVVYAGDECVLDMKESFGKNEGLYWGTPGEPAYVETKKKK